MRIKILGDCYYCVSGVPLQDEDHAYHSVQMGLDMITLIQVIKMMPQILFFLIYLYLNVVYTLHVSPMINKEFCSETGRTK